MSTLLYNSGMLQSTVHLNTVRVQKFSLNWCNMTKYLLINQNQQYARIRR